MFWMFTMGFSVIWMPWPLSSLTTFSTADRDSFSDFAPVQTILPVPKIKVAVFGFFNRKTRPGKTLGLYSVWGNFSTIFCRSIFWFKETDATIFWMEILGVRLLISDSLFRVFPYIKGYIKGYISGTVNFWCLKHFGSPSEKSVPDNDEGWLSMLTFVA